MSHFGITPVLTLSLCPVMLRSPLRCQLRSLMSPQVTRPPSLAMTPGGMLRWEASVWHWYRLSLNGSCEMAAMEVAAICRS